MRKNKYFVGDGFTSNFDLVSHPKSLKIRKSSAQKLTLQDLAYALQNILRDLPSHRDWLNPDVEHFAKAALKNAEPYLT